ncbi:MAG TPA: hypothetical protein VGV17_10620 [Bosea sp. (in: a-proteobacteria)]|uniref:hypothetical protein n=1 Tax=Bosea sp. (in: a-proteobacteria) TaxID=1871050 RepID=UPI002DDD6C41|nr:hypothetical protein [Bosea sp. (in: a-proteobacteria)]HEV2554202.1 hypothetical protein [Bosea sp. (in: a-proteobacteria)]
MKLFRKGLFDSGMGGHVNERLDFDRLGIGFPFRQRGFGPGAACPDAADQTIRRAPEADLRRLRRGRRSGNLAGLHQRQWVGARPDIDRTALLRGQLRRIVRKGFGGNLLR